MNTFISTHNSATIVLEGISHTIRSTHLRFGEIVKAGAASNWTRITTLLTKEVSTIETDGKVQILDDGTVEVEGRGVAQSIADRVHALIREGLSTNGISRFIERLDDNPDSSVRERLYAFMDASNIGISQEGKLGVYKRVREDFTDVHSGTFDNTPGKTVTMPRGEVDANHNSTCSNGLHVCSENYLESFSGAKVVFCTVDPADVVAVPHDYNDSKMRVSKYAVEFDITDHYLNVGMEGMDNRFGKFSSLVSSREPVPFGVNILVDLGHKTLEFNVEVEASNPMMASDLALDAAYDKFGAMTSFDVLEAFEV